MGMPVSKEARLFYRCAWQRMDEAKVLRKAIMTTGAVYLAGYGVECMLKALILSMATKHQQVETVQAFRGNQAHDFQWLRDRYLQKGGAKFPKNISRDFTLVSAWSTKLRYLPKTMKAKEADRILEAAEQIIRWADERL